MPADLEKINREKEKILSVIRLRGPLLPINIAKALNTSSLFSSAFLSELYSERKLFMSHLKIGSSSLYLIPGQENLLERFIDQLNPREREAALLIKDSKLLNDESLTPVQRVAMRAIKDFAIPLKVLINEDTKLFWKYYLLSQEETKELLDKFEPKTSKEKEKKEEIKQQSNTEEKTQLKKTENKDEDLKEISQNQEKTQESETKEDFSTLVKNHIAQKNIEIFDEIMKKKKEFVAKVRLSNEFGKQEYYLIAKDKKKISEKDLSDLHIKAQNEKMPAIFISQGTPDKKAAEYLQIWKNLIKYEKIN